MSPNLGIIASSISGHLYTLTGNYDALSTVTVPSGGLSSITFAGIPTTGYTHLQIRLMTRANTGGGTGTSGLLANFNSDTGANYTQHVLFGNGASASAAGTASTTALSIVNFPQAAETASAYGIGVIDILDYKNTSKYKTMRGLGGYDGNNTNGIVTLRSGVWMDTAAITQIDLTTPGGIGFQQYSSFALYGVK
jgi:hypothetical protein